MHDREEELLEKIKSVDFFEKTYEIMRIIDPVGQKVLTYQDNRISEVGSLCYHFWSRDKACKNCVAIKAYQENDVFIKLEYLKDKVMMITAIPFLLADVPVVIELLKNITTNMLVIRSDEGTELDIHSIMNNVNVNSLVLTDSLTGVYNRRFIDERMQVDMVNSIIRGESLSILMADLDFFKNVNDTYGHIGGDFILREVAEELSCCIRYEKDWIARYGGEEFLVCLPNTKKETAIKIAERMRKKIEERAFRFDHKNIKVTVSFGISSITNEEGLTAEALIAQADKNLYKAKKSGRNLVIAD